MPGIESVGGRLKLHNLDQFGYYRVGDLKTYSKLEAIEHSGITHKSVEWNFNKDIFESFDWTHEPPGSLEFWYGERARQIRNEYDYIVLWYSGGADSHNALMSFVKNNIFIDEIAQFHNLGGTNGDKQSWLNEEVFATSAPLTQNLIENNPVYRNTKHRLVDLFDIQKDILLKDNNKWDYFYKVGKYLSPNAQAIGYIKESVPEYLSLIDSGKRVCFIFGAEKPMVLKNKKWQIQFTDCVDNVISPRAQMLKRNWDFNELFYWSASLPQLIAKQAHVIRRYMLQLTPDMVDYTHITSGAAKRDCYGQFADGRNIFISAEVNGVQYNLTTDGLSRIIYPYWTPGAIVCGKPLSLAFSNRDHWMFESNAPDIGQKNYTSGLLHLRQTVQKISPKYWWEWKFNRNISPYAGGLVPFYNTYELE